MTYYYDETTPLGIGAILGEASNLLVRNFFAACCIALVPIGVGVILSVGLFGVDYATWQGGDFWVQDQTFYTIFFSEILLDLIAYSIATAMLVSFAYDVKIGRSKPLPAYVSGVASNLVPLIVISTISSVVIMIGTMALVIPGLWVYAVFSVIAPVIMMESAGFSALNRSAELTRNYRWPIVGLLIAMFIAVFIVESIFDFIFGFIPEAASNPILLIGLDVIAITVSFAFSCIIIAMLYARLREIKEGVSVDHLADVFS